MTNQNDTLYASYMPSKELFIEDAPVGIFATKESADDFAWNFADKNGYSHVIFEDCSNDFCREIDAEI